MIKRIVGISYSPAGGTALMTEMLAEEIAESLCDCNPEKVDVECYDLRDAHLVPAPDEETIVILGMPVYVGKIPLPAIKALREISGGSALTLGLVSYSGRNYGNALYELREFADERGFKMIGAGAMAISYRAVRGSARTGALVMDSDALRRYAKAASSKIKRLGGCEIEGLKIKPAPLEVKGRMPKHKISRLSPKAAAIAQGILDVIALRRQESEWFL